MDIKEFGLGAIESPLDMRDYTYDMISKDTSDKVDIPEEFILKYKFPILSQGKICSCVAHALSEMKSFIDDVDPNNMYSVGFIYANRNEDDYQGTGMITREALSHLVKDGDCFNEEFNVNEEYPDILKTLESKGKEKLFEKAAEHKSLAYIRLEKEDIKEYLVKFQKPILISVRVYENFYDSILNGGIIPSEPSGIKKSSHAMIIIGFKKDMLILVNSWNEKNGDNGLFYLDLNSSIIKELWVLEDEKKVNVPEVKKYKVGWDKTEDRKWIYSADGETLFTGWLKWNNKWYYLDSNGIMVTGWFKDTNSKWCYLDLDKGYAYCDRWVYIDGKWYMFDEHCYMKTGWVKYKEKWYYLEEQSNGHQGEMYCDGTFKIGDKEFSFDENGAWIENVSLVSDELIEFSKNFEGYSSKFENIGDGEQTIGYGTATSGTVGKRIWNEGIRSCTKEQALEWFKEEMNNGCSVLVSWCKDNNINLSQNKFDACADFIYNCGFGNFKKKIADIVLGNKPSDWSSWNVITTDAYGNFYQGLVTRRKGEMEIYNNGDYSRRP